MLRVFEDLSGDRYLEKDSIQNPVYKLTEINGELRLDNNSIYIAYYSRKL